MDITVTALRRSGHHAIIFWLLDNMGGFNQNSGTYTYSNRQKGIFYYNDCNHEKYEYEKRYNFRIKSYEDINVQENALINVVVVRDILNLLASRYKRWGDKLGSSYSMMSLDQIIKCWIDHVNYPHAIFYNRWLIDKSYRCQVSQWFNCINRDNKDFVPNIGYGSSFVGTQKDEMDNYLRRYKQVQLPKWITDKLKANTEVCELMRKKFFMKLDKLC